MPPSPRTRHRTVIKTVCCREHWCECCPEAAAHKWTLVTGDKVSGRICRFCGVTHVVGPPNPPPVTPGRQPRR